MAQPTIKAKDILGQSLERNRYFYGKLMTVRDFTQEQEHFTSKRLVINRLLFGSGVMCGLQVENSAAAPTTIEIKSGIAFDSLGREVTVVDIPGGNKFDLTKVIPAPSPPPSTPFTGEKKGFICLSYHECPKEPVPSLKSSSCDETCESNRLRETFDVSWDEDTATTPSSSLCEKWLNRATVAVEDAKFRVERATPVWVRAGEVFEVSLRVTAEQDATDIQITETRTGGSLIEPTPAQSATGQFPTSPVNLKAGEFFVYVYQVKSPAATGAFELSLSTEGLPAPTSKVEVLSEADAKLRESELTIESNCGEPTESCVRIAELTVHFTASKPDKVIDIKGLGSPRFRYSLERVTELLDCLRASLLSESGSPRPGHLFVTFNDRETKDPQPIGPIASPGTTPTFASGDHAHVLLRHEPSGLQFTGAGNKELWVNGNVGGESINFLNTVSGQTPVLPVHLVTKAYVDARIAGLDWQESVLDKDLTAPPVKPKAGDRYLVFTETPTGAWKGHQNDIAIFNGKAWDFNTPNDGAATFVEDENIAYLFVDGSWIPFLAAPSVTAGDGLVANGAVLSVGPGKGILVNPNDVGIAFEANPPQPIGPVVSASAGSSDFSNRSDHSHGLPLSKAGGLVFAEGGLSINGPVAGTTIDFLSVVSGQTPTSDRHVATKAYVDGKVAAPPKIGAGAGLILDPAGALAVGGGQGIIVGDDLVSVRFSDAVPRPGTDAGDPGKDITISRSDHSHPQQSITAGDGLVATGTVVSVGRGKGILVNPDDVAIAFETKLPQPIGPVGSASAGSLDTSANGAHSHGLPLSKSGGLVFAADGGLSVNGPVVGTAIDFQSAVLGQSPTLDRHLATKAYVDGKVVSPPKVVAGKGLTLDAAGVLAVGEGAGINVAEDSVSVRFSAAVPLPDSESGNPGGDGTLSQGNHVHPLSPITPLASTGLVAFKISGQVVTAQSGFIDPGLGKGPISVQLAFVTAADTFVFGPAGVFQASIPQLTAAVNSSGVFQISVTALAAQKQLPNGFAVRWFAYKPGVEGKQVDVVISPNTPPNT